MKINVALPHQKERSADEMILFHHERVKAETHLERRAISRVRLSRVLNDAGDWDAAFEQLMEANREAPDHPFVQRGLGLVQFRNGQIARGLSTYDKGRWRLPSFEKFQRPYAFPKWKGQPLEGKKILVWAEQGIGDQIMQARILPELVEQGAKVSVECEPRLIPLFRRALREVNFETQTVSLVEAHVKGKFDYQTSMFSAWRWSQNPGQFRKVLRCHEGKKSLYQNTVFPSDDERASKKALHVGLSWFSRNAETGKRRSVDLSALGVLNKISGRPVHFHNLQYGVEDPGQLEAQFGAPLLTDPVINPLADLDYAAGQLAAMDLVITIDNATAHMAGALGVPCWVLLPKGSEFRWQRHPNRSVLYPSLRLFRNHDSENWALTILAVERALETLVSV